MKSISQTKKKKKTNRKYIYTITTISWDRKKQNSSSVTRTWCTSYLKAKNLLLNNPDWFFEQYYRWAIIERIPEGGMVDDQYEHWFRFVYDESKVDLFGNCTYVKSIKKPKRFKNTISWAMSL